MHATVRKAVTLFAFLFICTLVVNAQFTSRFEVGVNAGTLIYQGDLSPRLLGYTQSLHPALGLYISKPLDNYFSFRLNFVRGRIGADESIYDSPAWRRFRNFKFSSSITEFTGLLSWNPLARIDRYDYRRLSPYFFAGAGFTLLNVRRDWSKFDPDFFGQKSTAATGLGVDTLHQTPALALVLPVGAGLTYTLSDRLSVYAEGTFRFTSSDLVDGFKYAADPKSKDHYYGLAAGVSYRFGFNETDCPKVRW